MNEAQLTVVGYVASTPTLIVTKAGQFVANMRVGVTPRRQDKETGQWSDGDTSYVTVTCWRSLATNVAACLRKGDPVVVKGRMRVRQFDDKDGNQRTAVEVDASTLGHDLTRGVAHFLRTKRSPGDAPPLKLAQHLAAGGPSTAGDDRFEPGGHSANGWQGRPGNERSADERSADERSADEPFGDSEPGEMADEPQPGHVPDDEFSGADLFDDAGIEASSAGFVAGAEGAGSGEVNGPDDPLPGSDGTDAQQAGRAA
jgi:single-strand DNA-binding protein